MNMPDISCARSMISSAAGKGSAKELAAAADIIMEFALDYESYPDQCFSIVSEFISHEEFFCKNGAADFTFTVLTDLSRFTVVQKEIFFTTLAVAYPKYQDEKLCWVVCDAICNHFPVDVAAAFLDTLRQRSDGAQLSGIELGERILKARLIEGGSISS